jgi:hypothetical protein
MARKLNFQEEQLFVEALQKESSSNDSVSEQYLTFSEKRDAPLRLTPELAAWLVEDPLGPTIS